MEQGNGVVDSGKQVVAEQVTVAQVEPVEPVTPGSMVAESEAPKKKGHGMVIGLVLCLLLAAGGIGFGVWAWMDGNAQKDALNSQIAELKKQNNELRDKLSSKLEVGEDVTVDVETDSDVNAADYIYVGEWGLKIKVPDSLKRVSYSFRQFSDNATVLWTWGNIDDRLPDFANPSNATSLGVVSRYLTSSLNDEQCGDGMGRFVLSMGDYNYCYTHPHGIVSTGDEEIGSEKRTIEIIEGMLANPENYSEI